MPIKQSAKKELRKAAKRYVLNRQRQKTMKGLIKKAQKLAVVGKIDEIKKLVPEIYQAIDKAQKRGVIKKNSAARKKSGLMKMIARVEMKK